MRCVLVVLLLGVALATCSPPGWPNPPGPIQATCGAGVTECSASYNVGGQTYKVEWTVKTIKSKSNCVNNYKGAIKGVVDNTDLKADGWTDSELKVLNANMMGESGGKAGILNTWDNQIVSWGLYQAAGKSGPLAALLYNIKTTPASASAFNAFFVANGLDVELEGRKKVPVLTKADGTKLRGNAEVWPVVRTSWNLIGAFFMAGNSKPVVVSMVREWRKVFFEPALTMSAGVGDYKFIDFVTSERMAAVLVRCRNWLPYYQKKWVKSYIQRFRDPSQWTDGIEQGLSEHLDKEKWALAKEKGWKPKKSYGTLCASKCSSARGSFKSSLNGHGSGVGKSQQGQGQQQGGQQQSGQAAQGALQPNTLNVPTTPPQESTDTARPSEAELTALFSGDHSAVGKACRRHSAGICFNTDKSTCSVQFLVNKCSGPSNIRCCPQPGFVAPTGWQPQEAEPDSAELDSDTTDEGDEPANGESSGNIADVATNVVSGAVSGAVSGVVAPLSDLLEDKITGILDRVLYSFCNILVRKPDGSTVSYHTPYSNWRRKETYKSLRSQANMRLGGRFGYAKGSPDEMSAGMTALVAAHAHVVGGLTATNLRKFAWKYGGGIDCNGFVGWAWTSLISTLRPDQLLDGGKTAAQGARWHIAVPYYEAKSAASKWDDRVAITRPVDLRAGDSFHTDGHIRVVAQVQHDTSDGFLYLRVYDSTSGGGNPTSPGPKEGGGDVGPGEKLWRVNKPDQPFAGRSGADCMHVQRTNGSWRRYSSKEPHFARLKFIHDLYASAPKSTRALQSYNGGYGQHTDEAKFKAWLQRA